MAGPGRGATPSGASVAPTHEKTGAEEPENRGSATAAAGRENRGSATAAAGPENRGSATAAAEPESRESTAAVEPSPAAAEPENRGSATAAAEPESSKSTAAAEPAPGSPATTAPSPPDTGSRPLTGRPRSLVTLLRRRRGPRLAPEPPLELPPGRIVHVPGRGEFFLRDSGGDGPALLLLHGWMVSADLNWITVYDALRDAGYRVLALDHRGHGRGLRTPAPFRLVDCADDAAAILRREGIERVVPVGYSMGGPIACLIARDHPDLVEGLVLCATATDWQEPHMKRGWRLMGLVRLELGLFPNAAWRAGLRGLGLPDGAGTTWAAAELSRASARDVAEAGRELGRYDGRPWLGGLRQPCAVIVPVGDTLVPQHKQRELARVLGVAPREVPGTHLAVTTHPEPFLAGLLGALADVRAPATLQGR